MDYYLLLETTFALFILMDSVGNIPIYMAVLKEVPTKRQIFIIIRELLIALVTIILFAFLGEYLLDILKIGQETIMIAGGVVLFIIALKMIFPKGESSFAEGSIQGEPFIVPLAIPLIAGPSSLAAVMIYSHQEPMSLVVGAICLAWLLTLIVLIGAPFLKKVLGVKAISACERLMGLLLTLMAVQMFLEGIAQFVLSCST
ncbi:MarC family protein [Candidatus Neptunochlamydia vexilliferae]|uniref:MarC family protein n=1 Tax=Candidatus Neptunichlamydia vexilliferae TaxID=1651774 RepID=UPI00189106CE|nr:MarC family protein [Candidatus Neptunochlamydia vexilliferae]